MLSLEAKTKYINQVFGFNVVEEFDMSEDVIDVMLTKDNEGYDIVKMFGPAMECMREIRQINSTLEEAQKEIATLKELLSTEGDNQCQT